MTTLPAVVRVVDLPTYTTITGAELLEAVQTSGGVGLSVQVPISAIMTTTLGALPVAGGTSQILAKASGTNFSAAWYDVTSFVSVNTASSLVTSGTGTAIVIGIPAGGITSTQIANNAVGTNQLASSLGIASSLSVGTLLTVGGTATFNGTAIFNATTIFNATAIFNSGQVVSGSFGVIGTTLLTGTLGVVGTSQFTGTFNVVGTSTFTGIYGVIGTALFTGRFGVVGTSQFTGALNVLGTTIVTGQVGIIGTSLLTGALGVVGTSQFTGLFNVVGTTLVTGTFGAVGTATFTANAFNVVGTAIFTSGAFGVVATSLFTGTFGVAGTTLQTGLFTVVGTASFTGGFNFNVIGTSLFTSGAFGVVGTATFTSNAFGVVGTALFTSAFGVVGTAIFTSNLFGAVGTSTFTGTIIFGSQGPGVLVSSATGVVSAQGGMVLLNTLTPNNVASATDTTSLTSAYKNYMILFDNVCPATQTTFLQIQVATSGANWISANYGSYAFIDSNGVAQRSAASTAIVLTGVLATNSMQTTLGYGLNGFIKVFNPSTSTAVTYFVGETAYITSNGVIGSTTGTTLVAVGMISGFWNGTTNQAITGLNFLFNSGNIQTGTIKIYGIT